MKNRKEIAWFAKEMEAKLRENDHKGKDGWKQWRIDALFPRIGHERDELLLALHPLKLDTMNETLTREDACEVIRECADIANFAMMIADNMREKVERRERAIEARTP